ncbi:DUF58 domain-containing protein [Tissierella pigra]|uniref:DUF58 domain-containing protein n=1 Tax=Tissierella pigra TaxID=2607614 RepID=UPI001C125C9B|nr:DUF58 domain-containing protein [Tissierella pigra]MBU5425938.1 DUF58 domain-containing protein [Tissierella pigra]
MNNIKISLPLIFFIIIFAFVLLVGGTLPYFLFYILLLTFILPLIHCLITLKRLKGSIEIPRKSLFTGEVINISYQVENNSILPIPYLEIQSNISRQLTGTNSPKVTLALEKKESYNSSESVILKKRGYYQFGEIEVTVEDVFGFYSFKKKITTPASLLVYPETIILSTFKITASHQSGELLVQTSDFQDKSRIASLREYREGDSVKAIHWKLSAKKDIPIIKDYENRGDTNVIIFLDNESKLFKGDIDRHLEDKSVDAALSIVNYCLSQNIEVNLETQNNQTQIELKGQQPSDLKPFLETLARFRGNGALEFKSILMSKVETLNKGSTVIIITPNLDKTMGAQGIQLKMKNLHPLFITITDLGNKTGYIDQMVMKRLKQEGIPTYILDYNTSIKEVLEVYHG